MDHIQAKELLALLNRIAAAAEKHNEILERIYNQERAMFSDERENVPFPTTEG